MHQDVWDVIIAAEEEGPHTARPLSAGLVISMLVHGAAAIAMMAFISSDFLPSQRQSPPVFDVALRADNSVRDSGADELVAVEAAPLQGPAEPAPEPAPPEPVAPPPVPEGVEVSERLPAIKPTELNPQTDIAASAPLTDEAVVTTSVLTDFAVTAVREIADAQQQPRLQAIEPDTLTELQEELDELLEEMEALLEAGEPVTWHEGERTFTATFERQAPRNDTDLERIKVQIKTEVDGRELATEMQVKRLAFSHFGQVVNRWDPDVALFNDEIEGRFHSNSRITVKSSRHMKPQFHGEVTVASSVDMSRGARYRDVFLGGVETRARRMPMPDAIAPVDIAAAARGEIPPAQQGRIQFIQADADIVFFPNGEFSWREDDQLEQRRALGDKPFYIIATDDHELSVEGTVNGSVVVYSPYRISISGNLLYANDPQINAQSDDFLGLISDRYVDIAPPDVTGPGDLTIHGAIYAKRRFAVRRFRSRNDGVLSIYGSLTAGTLSASQPRYGTVIHYDARLENIRPATFPMTNRYEVDQWNRQWQLAPAGAN